MGKHKVWYMMTRKVFLQNYTVVIKYSQHFAFHALFFSYMEELCNSLTVKMRVKHRCADNIEAWAAAAAAVQHFKHLRLVHIHVRLT